MIGKEVTMNKDSIQLNKECRLYEKALRKLPDKDHIKVSLAGISYITNGKVPHFRGIRKEVFKEIRPILERWKSLETPKSE